MNRLVLIDGNAVMHRAYHALPPLTDPAGNPVNIVYGFASMILKMYHDLKPTHMAVAFDRPGPTFRNELYAEYQTQRPKMEDDFVRQIPVVHDMVTAFGIPNYELDGFEADDMIGTICHALGTQTKDIDQIIVVTGDRDILQLVTDEKVLLFMPTKGLSEGKLYGEKEVVERMGVAPGKIPDFKALAGDPSDNYPGVAGIGPKTAADLINHFGSVVHVYQAVNKHDPFISGGVAAKLVKGKESAELSLTLARIRSDAPIDVNVSAMRLTDINTEEARRFLERMHFPSLIRRVTGINDSAVPGEKRPAKKKEKEKIADQQALF